jgi:hypothetical protein
MSEQLDKLQEREQELNQHVAILTRTAYTRMVLVHQRKAWASLVAAVAGARQQRVTVVRAALRIVFLRLGVAFRTWLAEVHASAFDKQATAREDLLADALRERENALSTLQATLLDDHSLYHSLEEWAARQVACRVGKPQGLLKRPNVLLLDDHSLYHSLYFCSLETARSLCMYRSGYWNQKLWMLESELLDIVSLYRKRNEALTLENVLMCGRVNGRCGWEARDALCCACLETRTL